MQMNSSSSLPAPIAPHSFICKMHPNWSLFLENQQLSVLTSHLNKGSCPNERMLHPSSFPYTCMQLNRFFPAQVSINGTRATRYRSIWKVQVSESVSVRKKWHWNGVRVMLLIYKNCVYSNYQKENAVTGLFS